MAEITPTHLSSASRYFGGLGYHTIAGGGALQTSTAWGTANLAWFLPLALPWTYTINRMFLSNGSTVNGNVDMGIYSLAGARLASTGAVAQSGASAIQYVSLASPLVLAAGSYLFGISFSSATATIELNTSVDAAQRGRQMGLYQMAAAHPLPATATFAAWASTGYPNVGVTRTASGF